MTDEAERPFEELQQELEEVVGTLERGEVGVDEAIRLWQRGERLLHRATALLEEAQGCVERLEVGTGDTDPQDV